MQILDSDWTFFYYEMSFLKKNRAYCMEGPLRRGELNTNLCVYFWRCIWGFVKVSFFTLVPATLALGSLLGLFVAFTTYWAMTFEILRYTFLISGLVVSTLLVIFIWAYIADLLDEKIKERRKDRELIDRPNLFIAYLKAKKAKVCPLVEIKSAS